VAPALFRVQNNSSVDTHATLLSTKASSSPAHLVHDDLMTDQQFKNSPQVHELEY
jgi:hypothetical protein